MKQQIDFFVIVLTFNSLLHTMFIMPSSSILTFFIKYSYHISLHSYLSEEYSWTLRATQVGWYAIHSFASTTKSTWCPVNVSVNLWIIKNCTVAMIVLNMVNTIAMFAYMLWRRKSLSVSENPTKNVNSLIFLMCMLLKLNLSQSAIVWVTNSCYNINK